MHEETENSITWYIEL